jgi:hypothetical protein
MDSSFSLTLVSFFPLRLFFQQLLFFLFLFLELLLMDRLFFFLISLLDDPSPCARRVASPSPDGWSGTRKEESVEEEKFLPAGLNIKKQKRRIGRRE